MPDAFAAYRLDVHTPVGQSELAARLAEHGLVTFDGCHTRAALGALVSMVGVPRRHRDSGDDAITVIADMDDEPAPGYRAFGRQELHPHTEGTAIPDPPVVMALVCWTPAPKGGVSYVIDGRALHARLAQEAPDALLALSEPRSAYFGGAAGHLGSVFGLTRNGLLAIRYRRDELGRYSPTAQRAIELLDKLAADSRLELPLAPGQGFILQNGRWLHGRTRFTGRRVMARLLGDPFPGTGIPYGFRPDFDVTRQT